MEDPHEMEAMVRKVVNQVMDERMATFRTMVECMINEWEGGRASKPASKTPTSSSLILGRSGHALHHNKFGMENYSYIPLSNIIKSNNDFNTVLQKIICALYFDPKHKPNHIVHIPPNTYRCIAILKNHAWKNYNMEHGLERVIRRANDVMQHYIIGTDEEEERVFQLEIGKKKYEMLREFTDKIDNLDEHQEFYEKLLRDTEHTIVTNQHLVHQEIYAQPQSD